MPATRPVRCVTGATVGSRLRQGHPAAMVAPMLRPLTVLVAAGIGTLTTALGDVIQIKGNASITGRILAEKSDQVVVDVGYTVLVVPRNQIESLSREETKPAAPVAPKPASTPRTNAVPAGETTGTPATGSRATNALFASTTGTGAERSVRELVALLGEAVVQVRAPSGLGSGFILNEEGYLITNFHVIEGETQLSVEVFHQRNGQLERKTYKQVRIVAVNKFKDLALLKIDDPGAPKFAAVVVGQTETLAVGERVFAIGSPLGLERTVTEGIVSTKTREMQGELFLQTTAQINPGNSGGPLFNLRGEVIGVTNMKISLGEGLGFAIPIEQVRHFLDHRDAFAYDNDNPSNAYRYLEPPRRMQQAKSGETPAPAR